MSRRGDHAAEVGRLVGGDRVVVHDVQRIALLAHVQPGQRAPGAADGVEARASRRRPAPSTSRAPRRRSSRPSSSTSRRLLQAAGRPAGRSRRRRSALPWMSTTSRLPPPRSPATPSGLWKPETTPSARQPRLLAAGEQRRLDAGDRLDRGDELRRRWRPRAAPRWRAHGARSTPIWLVSATKRRIAVSAERDRLRVEPAAGRQRRGRGRRAPSR